MWEMKKKIKPNMNWAGYRLALKDVEVPIGEKVNTADGERLKVLVIKIGA